MDGAVPFLLLGLFALSRSRSSTAKSESEGGVYVAPSTKPTAEEQIRRAGKVAGQVVDATGQLITSLKDLFGE